MILLDTVALFRILIPGKMRAAAVERVVAAEAAGQLHLSAASAWELCLLEQTGHTGPSIKRDGERFLLDLLGQRQIIVIPIDREIAAGSRRLPGAFHQDPADRFIVATARARGLAVVTSDRPILDYAKLGHVEALRC